MRKEVDCFIHLISLAQLFGHYYFILFAISSAQPFAVMFAKVFVRLLVKFSVHSLLALLIVLLIL